MQMKGHGEKLSRKWELAIAALLNTSTIAAAAKQAGIGEVTLWRWLKQPSFKRSYRAARSQVVESSIARLQYASGEAVEALRRNLTSGQPSVEVAAAKAILEQSCRALELIDLIERIERLESPTRATE